MCLSRALRMRKALTYEQLLFVFFLTSLQQMKRALHYREEEVASKHKSAAYECMTELR